MTSVLLMGHGSPDPKGRSELDQLRLLVERHLNRPITLGVLEHETDAMPSLVEILARLPQAELVVAQPLLLFYGLHGRQDIPRLVEDAARDRGLKVKVGRPLGDDPVLLRLAVDRVRAALAGPGDALLFVGRGSSSAEALEQCGQTAAAVAAEVGLPHAVAYAGISRPDPAEALGALAAWARRVIALPWLIHTGRLLGKVTEALEARSLQAAVPLAMLPHIGNGPDLVGLIERRIRALL